MGCVLAQYGYTSLSKYAKTLLSSLYLSSKSTVLGESVLFHFLLKNL